MTGFGALNEPGPFVGVPLLENYYEDCYAAVFFFSATEQKTQSNGPPAAAPQRPGLRAAPQAAHRGASLCVPCMGVHRAVRAVRVGVGARAVLGLEERCSWLRCALFLAQVRAHLPSATVYIGDGFNARNYNNFWTGRPGAQNPTRVKRDTLAHTTPLV